MNFNLSSGFKFLGADFSYDVNQTYQYKITQSTTRAYSYSYDKTYTFDCLADPEDPTHSVGLY